MEKDFTIKVRRTSAGGIRRERETGEAFIKTTSLYVRLLIIIIGQSPEGFEMRVPVHPAMLDNDIEALLANDENQWGFRQQAETLMKDQGVWILPT